MSNKLCLYGRGHFTEPEMCSLWLNISILHKFCRYFFVIASAGYNFDCVTTQHTTKWVENCSDNKLSSNYLFNFYKIFCKFGYNPATAFFFSIVE